MAVSSGTAGGAKTAGYGAGGDASFTAQTLIAPVINLTKQDGDLTFAVTNLQIGSAGTALTATGLGAGNAAITNLLLTGGGNFTLSGTASVGQLVINGGTLNDANWNNLVGGGIGSITYSNPNITLETNGATINLSGSQTLSRVLTGAGSLTKTGAGELILSNTNTYTGGTKISNGILSIAASTSIGPATTGANVINGGTLKLTGSGQTYTNNWTLTGPGNNIETANSNTISGTLSGTGDFTKTGAAGTTLTLTGNNDYLGDTTVNGGTLAGNIAADTNLTVAANATYDGTTAPRTVNALNGAGEIINSNGLTAQSGAFSGDISGAGSLTKTGAAGTTLTLSGNNTYLGDTTVNSGTLVVTDSCVMPTTATSM
ncbi:hypothetical protein AGMMS50256_21900 [Betaproteobacteria bacterium]|nr:hypothetical protein AGMMS50256_21900 [Betaproteobacteria bacterium]